MEILEQYAEHEQAVKRQIKGISQKVLRNMTEIELRKERSRIITGIQRWEAMVRAQPRWFRAIPEVRRERCVLKDEMQRVNSELMRRAHAAIEAEVAA